MTISDAQDYGNVGSDLHHFLGKAIPRHVRHGHIGDNEFKSSRLMFNWAYRIQEEVQNRRLKRAEGK